MVSVMRKTGLIITAALLLSACAIVHSKPNLPDRGSISSGQTITVDGNQNVYAIARDHNVSMRDIIVLNDLQPPYKLKPGQTLVLPAGSSGGGGSSYYPGSSTTSYNNGGNFKNGYAPAPSSSPSGAIEAQPLAPLDVKPVESVPLPPPVNPPKQSNINSAPLAPAPVLAAPVKSAPVKTTQVDALNKPSEPPKPVATTVSNLNKSEAASPPAPTPAPAASSSSSDDTPTSGNLVWPVKGPILSGFGPKGQGLNNDGINIGAPKGAPVVAAGNGIVVYAGNEMKGFGNLVLIRHKDGWVTAYAHLDRLLVQKDGVVAQGDEIGTVGKTGNVPSPQLHFETRYEGKPVDPSTVIKAQ